MAIQTNMYNYKQKKQRKSDNEYKNSYNWIKFIVVFVLLGITLGLLAYSPLFNITQIEVVGSKHYEKGTIVDLIDMSVGNNVFRYMGTDLKSIFTFRYRDVEEKIKRNCPYVKEAKVKLLLPSKVLVEIKERSPIGVIPYLGTSLLMDKEGYIIDTLENGEECSLPIIKGIEFEHYELGQKLDVKNPGSKKKALEVINIVKKSDMNSQFKIYKQIESIDVSDINKVCLFIDSRLVVNLGNLEDLRYRINALKHIYLKNLKKDDKGLIDFTIGDNPIFIPEK